MALFDGDILSTSPSESGATVAFSSEDSEDGHEIDQTVGVILDATPFYAEAGGQMADSGKLLVFSSSGEGQEGDATGVIEVADVRLFGGFALHVGRLVSGR